MNILNHTADANVDAGIDVDTGNGKLNILAPQITNNGVNGIRITDFTNIVGDNTIISGAGNVSGLLDNNGLGGSNLLIQLTQPGLMQNVLITDTIISGSGGSGVIASATGAGTVMNIDIRDEVAVTDNFGDGISLAALESATINANIGNPNLATAPLQITNNAFLGGAGISILASGTAGNLDLAAVNANISNVAILNDESVVEATAAPDPDVEGATIFVSTTGIDIDSIGSAIVDVSVLNSTIGNPALTAGQNVTTGVAINLANDTSFNRKPNNILLDDLELTVGFTSNVTGNNGTGVSIFTGTDTLSDIVISDSIIRPNALATGDADMDGIPDPSPQFPLLIGPNDEVFGDTQGNSGIVLVATGAALADPDIFVPNLGLLGEGLAGPGTSAGANSVLPFDIVSDGVEDNLTRLTLLNNTVRDFTFDGVDLSANGDARLLLNISGNTIANNGAGLDNDVDNDNVFGEQPEGPPGPAPDQLTFFDGINIDAFDVSTISARITGNEFRENLERGLSLNTFADATINAIVSGNGFFGNDRGEDANAMTPLLSVGGNQMGLQTSAASDLEVINNEEFFFRPHETPVFTLQTNEFDMSGNQDLFDPLGVDDMGNVVGAILEDMAGGVFIPGNTGMDIFGNPIPVGQATINFVDLNNGFQLGTDLQNFAFDPVAMATDPTALTVGDFGLTDGLISAEELNFLNRCIPNP